MLEGRGRRRLLPRKLSALTSEELGVDIQQQPYQKVQDENTQQSEGVSITNASSIGHSSVEDAAAALRLYWHRYDDWEHALGYPLKPIHQNSTLLNVSPSHEKWQPLEMYLDGCNLPIGMRGIKMKEYIQNYQTTMQNNGSKTSMTIPSKLFQLVSKVNRGHNSDSTSIDWYPHFQSALRLAYIPRFSNITIMWDGSKFRDIMDKSNHVPGDDYVTKLFSLENSTHSARGSKSVLIEITCDGDSADDVLYQVCTKEADIKASDNSQQLHGKIISLDSVIELFSRQDGEHDDLSQYVVIRRKSGGTKTHRRLFDKLHLRRPDEGALCLTGLTSGLRLDSWKISRELQREKGAEKVIECEVRKREDLRYVVITDDVFLTERLTRSGVVLVLSYRQLENMF